MTCAFLEDNDKPLAVFCSLSYEEFWGIKMEISTGNKECKHNVFWRNTPTQQCHAYHIPCNTEMAHYCTLGRPAPEGVFAELRCCHCCDWAEFWCWQGWRGGGVKPKRRRRGGGIDADERKGSDRFRREAAREGWRDGSKERNRGREPSRCSRHVCLLGGRFSASALGVSTKLLPWRAQEWNNPMINQHDLPKHSFSIYFLNKYNKRFKKMPDW